MREIVKGKIVSYYLEQELKTKFSLTIEAFGVLQDRKFIGGIAFTEYNKANVFVQAYGSGPWLYRQFGRVVFSFAYDFLQVKSISACISSANAQSLKFAQQVGFKQRGHLPFACVDGDMLIFQLLRHECKWLNTES